MAWVGLHTVSIVIFLFFIISRGCAHGLRRKPQGHVDVKDFKNDVLCGVGGVTVSVRAQDMSTRYEQNVSARDMSTRYEQELTRAPRSA